jgi:hypothetical protein
MKERVRTYKKGIQDTLDSREKVIQAIASGADPSIFEVESEVPEADITRFCQGCDNFGGEGIPCNVAGSNDQARYSVRKWCGWASVKGERVIKQG